MSLELNKVYHGFKLYEEKEVKEINSLVRLFLHEKSGARLLHIANEDDNKVFSISFRTPPNDSTGLPHILEHSVLCGSRKFPLKDPFVQLAKGSLNTFLNAMTFPDKTMYPVASTNDKDFRNLMDVYLDAVLHPRIYQAKEILMQEGWHYDIEDKNQELNLKGVVYNEMKGALSSPEAVLFHKNMESLFPDTPYHFESGGDPDFIPDLTQEDFLAFHQKYYHPANSFIYLYGNGDILDNLQFINDNYLAEFDAIQVDSKIPLQPAFKEMKEVINEYPILPNEEEKDKTYFSLNYVIGNSTNAELYLAFDILEYLLLETSAAPLKKALLEADLGQDVFGVYDNSMLQPVLSIVVKNSNPDKQAKFLQVVQDTLAGLVKNGLDKILIEAAINRKEFDLREADYHGFSKGLLYAIKCMDSWLYGANPTLHLRYEETLGKIKSALTTNYFEKLIDEYLLKNSHSSLMILKPKKGLAEEKAEALKKQLADFKAKLSEDQINEFVEQTLKLRKIQEEQDAPQDLEKIPMLDLKDIKPTAEEYKLDEKEIEGVKLLSFSDFTNQIGYVNLYFDLSAVPEDLLPYVGMLANILTKVNTENYSYGDLSNQINIHTGGIGLFGEMFLENGAAGVYHPKLTVKSKALVSKSKELVKLLKEILMTSKFDDKNRVKEVLQEIKSRMEMAMFDQGHVIAKNRALSYISPRIKYLEYVNGLAYYKHLAGIVKDFEGKYEELKTQLEKVSKLIFNKTNLLINVTCENVDYQEIENELKILLAGLGQQQQRNETKIKLEPQNEGLVTPGKVQYVAKVNNYLKLGYQYNGSMQVLRTILSLDYLWNKVRVQGGAYGCFAGFERDGDMFFVSYRDPNLKETLNIYSEVVRYLENFSISDREMKKYIIGTISKLDFPLTPSGKGERAAAYYISSINYQDRQTERDQVLATDQSKIQSFAEMFKKAFAEDYICVLGSESKIKQNQELFKNIITVFE